MTEQSKRVFQNIETILDRAGARPEHIFKISAFLTDMSRYSEYSAERTRPQALAVDKPNRWL